MNWTTCASLRSYFRTPASAVLVLCLSLFAAATPARAQEPSPRQDLILGSGWRFVQQDVDAAPSPGFDDAGWRSVQVPHCWNIEPGQNGDKADFYSGPGWYRLHIKPDPSTAGKSLFLKFDAAYHAAEVYLNGKRIGSHVGGFTAFCFDVTGLMRPGEDNVLAVRVLYDPPKASTPLGGDYTKFPGLYREVHLLVLDPVSLSPLDEGSCGVYLRQTKVSDAAATIDLATKLRNGSDHARKVTVQCRLLDATGAEVQRSSVEQSVPAAGVADASLTLTLKSPHLWNGRIDPYLYRAEVEVLEGGAVRDRVIQPLGLRYFRADPKLGFFLNGKHYPLHGVNRHQDRIDKGWAISRSDMEQDVSILLDMGCTCVRLSHYPNSDTFYDLCDKAGLVVWSEIPLTGGAWTRKGDPEPDWAAIPNPTAASARDPEADDFMENARRQLHEMIKQETNHPSIIFWGLWNEIGGRKGVAENDFLGGLVTLAKQLDPTRLTTAANNDEKNQITDVVGRNVYFGWYSGKPDDLETQLPVMLAKNQGKPLIISEYGAGASVLQHQIDPTGVVPKGLFHPEEYQSLIHEKAWKALSRAPYLTATFAWVAMDLSSITRNEGDHAGRNDKGLVTYDRTIRKDTFYFYKANWNPEPMVYITSRRFSPHPAGQFPVKIYSNCPEVELRVNGKSQGVRTSDGDCVFVWDNVTYPEGQMRIEAIGKHDGKPVTDACVLACSPATPHRLDLSGRTRQEH